MFDVSYGNCGKKQAGATSVYGYGSHGMCPLIFSLSFLIDFPLVPIQTLGCISQKVDPDISGDGNLVAGYRFNTS